MGMTVLIFLAAAFIVAGAGFAPHPAFAQAEAGSPPEPLRPAVRPPLFAPLAAKTASRSSPELREERGFIKSAAAAARFQAEAGKLALTKSSSARVRYVAADAVARHAATLNDFARLLHVRGLAMPMLDNNHRRMLKDLAKLGGSKFDREYLDVALRHTREDVRQYEKTGLASSDPSLRGWVERQLPALRSAAGSVAPQSISARPSESNSR